MGYASLCLLWEVLVADLPNKHGTGTILIESEPQWDQILWINKIHKSVVLVGGCKGTNCIHKFILYCNPARNTWIEVKGNLPRFTSLFHTVGNNDITRPNIVLPFAHTQKTTQDLARMNTNTHVKSLFKFPFFSENTNEGD